MKTYYVTIGQTVRVSDKLSEKDLARLIIIDQALERPMKGSFYDPDSRKETPFYMGKGTVKVRRFVPEGK